MKRQIAVFLTVFLVVAIVIGNNADNGTAVKLDGEKILVFLGVGYAYEQYEYLRSKITSWGGVIKTAGSLDPAVSYDRKEVSVNFLISDLDSNDISDYDCIYVPGGGYGNSYLNDEHIKSLVQAAYDSNIWIIGQCAGTRILAKADILNGTRIAGYSGYTYDYSQAGALYDPQASVVVEGKIITATNLASQELAYRVADELGHFFQFNWKITRTDSQNPEQGYTIIITTPDYDEITALWVNVSVLDESNQKSLVNSITIWKELNETSTKEFTGEIGILEDGKYTVDVKVEINYGKYFYREDIKEFSIPVSAAVGWSVSFAF
ncbi:MAG: DJ-1/PfpI family protein, partial [Candidatus Odinarchaeota archaeon]